MQSPIMVRKSGVVRDAALLREWQRVTGELEDLIGEAMVDVEAEGGERSKGSREEEQKEEERVGHWRRRRTRRRGGEWRIIARVLKEEV